MFWLGDDPVLSSRVPEGARRALAALACWSLGIAVVHGLWAADVAVPASAWASGAALCAAVALVTPPRWLAASLALGVVLLGAAWASHRWLEPADDTLLSLARQETPSQQTPTRQLPVELEVEVLRSPEPGRPAEGALARAARWSDVSWSSRAAVHRVRTASGWRQVRGRVTLLVGDDAKALRVGERVRLRGLLLPPRRALNPGRFDPRLRAAETGWAGTVVVGGWRQLAVPSAQGRFVTELHSARNRARRAIVGGSSRDDPAISHGAAVASALVLGEREPGSAAIRSAFARQGVSHLLAISGFHLLLVCAAARFMLRLASGGRGTWAEPLSVALVIGLFLLLVPARAPVMRAACMAAALLLAEASGRRHHGLGVLAWVGVAMLAWRPSWLFDVGFQLSFVMTGALIWLGGRVDAWLARRRLDEPHAPPDVLERGWWAGIVRAPLSASIVCWLVALPVVAAKFGWISPLGILSTLLLMPIVAAIVVGGFVTALLAAVGLAPPTGGWLERLGSWCASLVLAIDGWPWSRPRWWPMPEWMGWLGSVIVLAAIGAARTHRRWVLAAGAAWIVGAAAFAVAPRLVGPEARVDMFAVGDGTCFVVSSKGDHLLWDAGSTRPELGVFELPRAMRAAGIGRVRTAIITHANFDHYSALPDLCEPLGLERVLVSDAFMARASEPSVSSLLDALARAGVRVESIDDRTTLQLGVSTLDVLLAQTTKAAVNEESVVAALRTPSGRSVLLTGDIQGAAIDVLSQRLGPTFRADVLELPHHGSATREALELLAGVDPSVVLQSTGPRRADDPRWAAAKQGRFWRTTATDGWTRVDLRPDRVTVTSLHARSGVSDRPEAATPLSGP